MKTASLVLALLAGLSLFASARADQEIPAYQVLSCEKDCPPSTPAKLLTSPQPDFPYKDRGNLGAFVEAIVDVDFTIAADGSVKDAAVEYLLGPQEFADNVLLTVRERKYAPATENGVPVEENRRERQTFTIAGTHVARDAVVTAYDLAMKLATDGKLAEAIAALDKIAAEPRLNFYERAMVGDALVALHLQTGDVLLARDAIRVATIFGGRYLDERVREKALRQRIRLEAATGEFAEAFAWHRVLRSFGQTTADDAAFVEKLHGLIAAPEPLAMDARMPAAAAPGFWQHTLLRRSFEFHRIAGKLDRFDMRCERHSIRSAISETADWTVPASWNGCVIDVFGAPGTTFQFVELHPAP